MRCLILVLLLGTRLAFADLGPEEDDFAEFDDEFEPDTVAEGYFDDIMKGVLGDYDAIVEAVSKAPKNGKAKAAFEAVGKLSIGDLQGIRKVVLFASASMGFEKAVIANNILMMVVVAVLCFVPSWLRLLFLVPMVVCQCYYITAITAILTIGGMIHRFLTNKEAPQGYTTGDCGDRLLVVVFTMVIISLVVGHFGFVSQGKVLAGTSIGLVILIMFMLYGAAKHSTMGWGIMSLVVFMLALAAVIYALSFVGDLGILMMRIRWRFWNMALSGDELRDYLRLLEAAELRSDARSRGITVRLMEGLQGSGFDFASIMNAELPEVVVAAGMAVREWEFTGLHTELIDLVARVIVVTGLVLSETYGKNQLKAMSLTVLVVPEAVGGDAEATLINKVRAQVAGKLWETACMPSWYVMAIIAEVILGAAMFAGPTTVCIKVVVMAGLYMMVTVDYWDKYVGDGWIFRGANLAVASTLADKVEVNGVTFFGDPWQKQRQWYLGAILFAGIAKLGLALMEPYSVWTGLVVVWPVVSMALAAFTLTADKVDDSAVSWTMAVMFRSPTFALLSVLDHLGHKVIKWRDRG